MKIIKTKVNRILQRGQRNALHIVFFSLLFSLLGLLSANVPNFYYKYFDKTEYYKFELPIEVINREVKACENVYYVGKRTALKDLELTVTTDLLKVEDGVYNQVYIYPDKVQAIAGQGEVIISGSRQIPCDIEEGTYILRFFTHYAVYGTDRIYSADTEDFTVTTQTIIVK